MTPHGTFPAENAVARTLDIRPVVVLGRWTLRMGARRLVRQALHSLQGRIMLLVSLLAVFPLVDLLRTGGPVGEAALSGPALLGALVLAHVSMLATLIVMVPVMLAKDLLTDSRRPLDAHPSFLSDLAVVRAGFAVLTASVYLTVFFHVFHARVVLQLDAGGAPQLILHIATMLIMLVAVGVAVAAAVRKKLRGAGAHRRARLIQKISVAPFFVTLTSFVLIPSVLAHRAPGRLAAIGRVSEDLGYFLLAPLGFVFSSASGSAAALGLWAVGLGTVLAASVGVLARQREHGTEAATVSAARPSAARRPLLLRDRRDGPRWIRDLRLFWAKDVRARGAASPSHLLQLQGGLLVIGILSVLAARSSSTAGGSWSSGGILAPTFAVGVACALGLARGVGSLGEEGERVALLRPVMSPGRLLRAKTAVSTAYVLAWTLLHALAIQTGVWLAGLEAPRPAVTLAAAIGAAVAFGWLGTAVGFVLPDFSRRSVVLPGASLSGRIAYGAIAGMAVGPIVTALYLWAEGLMGGAGLGAIAGAVLAVLFGVAASLSAWSVRRAEVAWR